MSIRAITEDLASDIRTVNNYLEVAEDMETRMGLSRLLEVLRSWNVSTQVRNKEQ
jgi:hypothetical protein